MRDFDFKKYKKNKIIGFYVSAGNKKHSCLDEQEFVERVSDAMKYFKKRSFKSDGVESTVYQQATFFVIHPVYDESGMDFDQSAKVLKSELEFK